MKKPLTILKALPLWQQALLVALLFVFGVYAIGTLTDQALGDLKPNATERSLPRSVDDFQSTFLRYDSDHYHTIVSSGYNAQDVAFFPLYPLLVRGVHIATGLPVASSLLAVSVLAFCGTVIVMAYWLRFELRSRKVKLSPWMVVGLFLVFPTSFFLVLGYTESLFLLLTVSALYAYRTERYWLVTILLFFATLTRVQGGALAVLCLADYIALRRWKGEWRRLLPIAGAVLGLASYMTYLYIDFGSPLAFIEAQRHWGRLGGNTLVNLISSFKPVYLWYLPILAYMLWAIRRYLGMTWLIYAAVFILIPLASGRLDSLNRYMLGLPILFLALALAFNDRRSPAWRRTAYIVSAAFLLAWSMLLFLNGYWVA